MAPAPELLVDADTAHRHVPNLMGGSAHLTAVGARGSRLDLDALLDGAEARLRQLELRWSRFLPESEISVLNRAEGRAVMVSDDTIALVRAMVSAWRLTDGLVDAALLREVVATGYDRSVLDPAAVTILGAGPAVPGSIGDVSVDPSDRLVTLPSGLALDPGGLGKGLAGDLVVEELIAAGAAGALVEISGDVRVAGEAPTAHGWFIDIADPHDSSSSVARVAVGDGGIATSSVLKRRWIGPDGDVRHHLIGRDGRPARHGLATSTAVVGSAALAEVMAKLPLLVGEDEGLDLLDAWEIPALVVRTDGGLVATRYWDEVAV